MCVQVYFNLPKLNIVTDSSVTEKLKILFVNFATKKKRLNGRLCTGIALKR